MANTTISALLLMALIISAGCATKKVLGQTPLILELGNPIAQKVTSPKNKFEYRAVDHLVFVGNASASKFLGDQKDVCKLWPFSVRYCPNFFDVQPEICVGAITGVFLSDRKIDALQDTTATLEKSDVSTCCLVEGTALALGKCEN